VVVDQLAGIVQVQVRSSLGNPLRNVRVTIAIVDMKPTVGEQAKRFFDALATGVVEHQPAAPVIDPELQTALTDASGRATFSIKIIAGVTGDYSFIFQAAGIKSASSRPFHLTNPIASTARCAFSTEFTLEDAIGSHACSLEALLCVRPMAFLSCVLSSYQFTL
jgi:hypothetical protein